MEITDVTKGVSNTTYSTFLIVGLIFLLPIALIVNSFKFINE